MSNFYNLSDLLLFAMLSFVVVCMIVIAEVMRATAKYCTVDEAVSRLKFSIGLFRAALILLMLYGANQTLETHQLKETARISRPVNDGSKIAEAIKEIEYDVVLSSGTKISWRVVDERKRRGPMSGAKERSIAIDGSRSASGFDVDGPAYPGTHGVRDGKFHDF